MVGSGVLAARHGLSDISCVVIGFVSKLQLLMMRGFLGHLELAVDGPLDASLGGSCIEGGGESLLDVSAAGGLKLSELLKEAVDRKKTAIECSPFTPY